jgi:hypothetical protein
MSTSSPGSVEIQPLLVGDDGDAPLVENGVPGLFSRHGFQYAWTDYQTHCIEQLNRRLADGMSNGASSGHRS